MTHRLPARTGEVIDRSVPLRFSWNGETFAAYAGDTIASALAAGGVSLFSRSFKYHRPRGILTADHNDPNLFVQVGDEPNVRAGHRLAVDGMQVTAQTGWPSLRYDARSGMDRLSRFLPPGFYYKTFMGPRRLQEQYQRVLRRFGAGGQVSRPLQPHPPEKRFAHPDVLVAGGGPAGMAAALAAAEAGASVMLVEEEHQLGGHLRFGDTPQREALDALRKAVAGNDAIEVITNGVVTGRYDHNWIAVLARSGADEHLIKARAKCLVVAAGKLERPWVFEGNDLPGVMLSRAALRLINLWAVAPGTRAVVATANSTGDFVVDRLGGAGIDVVEVINLRTGNAPELRAQGRHRVSRVEVAGRQLEVDLLVTAAGWTTPTSLLNMAGDRPSYRQEAARFIPGDLPDDVLATGEIVGDGTVDAIVAHGSAVGREAAQRALRRRADWLRANPRATDPPAATGGDAVAVPALDPAPHPEVFIGSPQGFVDFSEDVRAKDIAIAVEEGYDSIELAKRYTTATMGPVQGKLEVVNTVAAHAAATGSTIAETGTTTWRPPYAPMTLSALAGREEAPIRRSPMHDWHVMNGASPLVAGQWIRPDHYRDPAGEVRNTRERVGIIDVSPLGKIDLRGGDVLRLLDLVYINRWARLDVGRVRYGAMCGEDGVVFDDGVAARLGDDHFYMTTTSSGAGRVWNWLDEWLQTAHPSWDVRMTAITDGYAAMNVAGPRSRTLLERVVEGIDLSSEAFGYMNVRRGMVAGVSDCILLRIGFTGELSFEVHVPAGFGLHVWSALLEAGADLGIAPFGVEAQRIMRLEKGHLIVGQDTDGLTKAHAAALGWAVKLDKPDFAGRPELAWEAASGPTRMLVAVQTADPQLVPTEASQIVSGDAIVGRITSSRMSPTLGRSVCLAMVEAALASPGTPLMIELGGGERAVARVLEHLAHYDPDGERLHG